jgi:hypothetical protein
MHARTITPRLVLRLAAAGIAGLVTVTAIAGAPFAQAQDWDPGTHGPTLEQQAEAARQEQLRQEQLRQEQLRQVEEIERQYAEQQRAVAAEQERLNAITRWQHEAAVAEAEEAQRQHEEQRAAIELFQREAAGAEHEAEEARREAAITERERAEALERARREWAERRRQQAAIKQLRMQEFTDAQRTAAEDRRAVEPWAALSDLPRTARCDELTDDEIPQLVADIFRCRLRGAGFSEAEVWWVTAEAVTVARCESLYDPDIVVFNGMFSGRRHPLTGSRYTAAGVFQFIRSTADDWIVGGYDNVFDATANIDAAARLYLHNRANGLEGWEDWACAAANDGFKSSSALPLWPGGPDEMPDWAFRY